MVIATRLTLVAQSLCAAFFLLGLWVAASMADPEARGMIIAMQAGLPLVLLLPLAAIGSLIVLVGGERRDRIRLGIWYALAAVLSCCVVFLDVLNKQSDAMIAMPVAAAATVLPVWWLLKRAP